MSEVIMCPHCEEYPKADEWIELERELAQARKDLKLSAAMLAKQCDLARDAEAELASLKLHAEAMADAYGDGRGDYDDIVYHLGKAVAAYHTNASAKEEV